VRAEAKAACADQRVIRALTSAGMTVPSVWRRADESVYEMAFEGDRGAMVEEKRTFAVVLEPEDEGGITVRVPAFPEIVTYGIDEYEALAMAEDAIRLVIAGSAL
jgi:predicted RNase H-like HicB family nuclease